MYVGGYTTLDMLAAGVPTLWEIDEADEDDATRLTMVVIGLVSEYDIGAMTEDDIRDELREEASWQTRSFAPEPASPTEDFEVEARPVSDTQLLMVSW